MFDATEVAAAIIDNYDVKIAPYKRAIIVDSRRVPKNIDPASFSSVFQKALETLPVNDQLQASLNAKTVIEEVIVRLDLVKEEESAIDPDAIYYTNDERFPYTQTAVLVCPSIYKRYILYNTVTGDFEIVHIYYFKDKKLPKELPVEFRDVVEVYDPRLPPHFYTLTEQEQEDYPTIRCGNVWNSYTPPKYMSLPKSSVKKCHPTLIRFFTHLFPTAKPRLYVLRWLRTMLTDFESTLPILLLCGKAGVGKNTLVENIMVGLVGQHNFHKAAQQSERFNSSVTNCVLHFTDEGEVDGIIKRNFKSFHELFVAIERKGVDVSDPERIFARFVLATNNKRDIRLDYNDRKFSVPEITDTKLLEAFTEDETQWLFRFKHDSAAIREFRDYLVDNYDNVSEPYHGELFDEICYESLPSWFRSFIKMAKEGEEFTFKTFKKEADYKRLNIDTVLHQLDNYEHQIGKKICDHWIEDGVEMFKGVI